MPSGTSKPILLIVVMLSVVTLNVVEPIFSLEKLEFRVFKLLQKLQSNRLVY